MIEKHDIPHSMIINIDQTPLKYVPTANFTLAEKGAKSVISIIKFLPMQLIYDGKLSRVCLASNSQKNSA